MRPCEHGRRTTRELRRGCCEATDIRYCRQIIDQDFVSFSRSTTSYAHPAPGARTYGNGFVCCGGCRLVLTMSTGPSHGCNPPFHRSGSSSCIFPASEHSQRSSVPLTGVLMERRCRAARSSDFSGSFGNSSWVPRTVPVSCSAATARCDVVSGACGVCRQSDGGQQ